ncbi:MAG: hypothetical protein D6785_03950 [Planctomycetota bacterium]|nr:MAG: hypothetical protein D6785_03950 [Planctomycetota bacterium]
MKDRLDKLLSDKQSGSLTPQGELELLKLKKDPYLSYGFGFAVNKTVLNNGQLSNDLYQFQIKIFRNWVKAKGHKANKPIREIGTLISF